MPEFLEAVVDKFTFKVARDRLYTESGMWAKREGERVRVGVTDFLQQSSGDVAFVEVKHSGAAVRPAEELATIETVKVNVSLGSPVTGKVVETNPVLRNAPETINFDPYGAGWLAVVEPADWTAEQRSLLSPEVYLQVVQRLAGERL